MAPWRRWLEGLGYRDLPENPYVLLAGEPERPAEHGISAFLTDHLIGWLARREGPWFAHASYLRPHPPYAAAGHWSRAYDPADVPPPGAARRRHHLLRARGGDPGTRRTRRRCARCAAQYYGMISDVDEQLGRVFDTLVALGMWEDTCIVVTSDHGEQLGDQGRLQKGGYFESSYHIVGIVRDPRHPATFGRVVDSFTENVDLFPTICEAMGVAVPAQCDGLPLTPFLVGEDPPWWRDAATWEYDWRWEYILFGPHPWPWDRRLERKHLAVRRTAAARLRAVRRRDGALLRPGRRPHLAHRDHRPGPRPPPGPGHARLARRARRAPARRHALDRRRRGPGARHLRRVTRRAGPPCTTGSRALRHRRWPSRRAWAAGA